MTAQPLWQQLKALIALDQQCVEYSLHIQELENKLDDLDAKLHTAQAAYAQTNETATLYQTQVTATERKISELDAKEKELKKKEGGIKDHKSLMAHQKEVALLQAQRKELEDVLVTVWHQLETAQKQCVLTQKSLEIAQEEHAIEVARVVQEIDDIETQIEQLEVQQEQELAHLPEEWSTRYRNMRGKVNNPIVPIMGNQCSACYYQILPQDLARIKKNALLPCHNCYRYLYYDPAQEVASQTATY